MKNTPEFIILIGLPGSGKSTFCDQNNYNPDLKTDNIILSTDFYIENKARMLGTTYSAIFKETIDEATKAFNEELDKYSKLRNQSLILDQTNLTVKKRAKLLSKAQDYHYKSIYYFDVPLEIIKERVEKRGKETGKLISFQILEDMYARLEPPTYAENVDRIIIFDEFGNVKRKN